MVRPCVARRFRRIGGCGLASMYPASDWSGVLRAIMDISARAFSLADRPRSGHGEHSLRILAEDGASARVIHRSGKLHISGNKAWTGRVSCLAAPFGAVRPTG